MYCYTMRKLLFLYSEKTHTLIFRLRTRVNVRSLNHEDYTTPVQASVYSFCQYTVICHQLLLQPWKGPSTTPKCTVKSPLKYILKVYVHSSCMLAVKAPPHDLGETMEEAVASLEAEAQLYSRGHQHPHCLSLTHSRVFCSLPPLLIVWAKEEYREESLSANCPSFTCWRWREDEKARRG